MILNVCDLSVIKRLSSLREHDVSFRVLVIFSWKIIMELRQCIGSVLDTWKIRGVGFQGTMELN